jgi:hypothetical protein
MIEILTVHEGYRALDKGLDGHRRNPKKITPPEALRRIERGAISNLIIDIIQFLSRARGAAFCP